MSRGRYQAPGLGSPDPGGRILALGGGKSSSSGYGTFWNLLPSDVCFCPDIPNNTHCHQPRCTLGKKARSLGLQVTGRQTVTRLLRQRSGDPLAVGPPRANAVRAAAGRPPPHTGMTSHKVKTNNSRGGWGVHRPVPQEVWPSPRPEPPVP